ncbi:MAG: hypothetical protein KAJ40_08275 [Alphaproteobacteria bacterium]|nr:hypothetical protein [Alphaproteobacteria bacterium]
MSKSAKQPIENAVEIIEKFGGIRPMASKTGVAVTTIQGWKKRGVIPAARKEAILKTAEEHEVDLSELIEGAPPLSTVLEVQSEDYTVENNVSVSAEIEEETADADEAQPKEPGEDKDQKNDDDSDDSDDETEAAKTSDESDEEEQDDLEIPASLKRTVEAESGRKVKEEVFLSAGTRRAQRHNVGAAGDNYTELRLETKKSGVARSVIITMVIILVIFAALAGLLIMPKYKNFEHRDARIEELESKLSALKKEQSSFKGLIPGNWSEELEQLKRQAAQVKQGVNNTVNGVKSLSHDLASDQGINSRVQQLQTYVSEISGEHGVYALKSRFNQMRQDFMGEKVLDSTVQALLPLVQQAREGDGGNLDMLIAQARTKNKALQSSFGNVPQSELKAVAMLLAMTQVRSSLNRSNDAFDSDLQLLMNMVGEDNLQLKAAIEKLAPYAQDGVLTPSGVKKEFQTVAGDAVAASLRGEDVSVSEKLSAKFNELLKVEKDGELLTGTQTQSTLNKAENMVEDNRFEDAIALLKKNLRAKELKPLRPWIKRVEGLLASRKVSNMLEEAIELNFGPGLLGGQVLENSKF